MLSKPKSEFLLLLALLLTGLPITALADNTVECEITRRSDNISARHQVHIPTGGSHEQVNIYLLDIPMDEPNCFYFFASRLDGDLSDVFVGRVKDGETIFGDGDVRSRPLHFQDKSISIACSLLPLNDSVKNRYTPF